MPLFPGMDPYIEGQAWKDFHLLFIGGLRSTLTPLLRPNYLVRAGEAVVEPPVVLSLPQLESERQVYLEVRRRATGAVVCVIELLSPTNKLSGPGRQQYLRKRAATLESPAHLVELDLLRDGPRLPMDEPLPPADYYVFVSRTSEWPLCGVWPIGLRERLPAIPIPLLPGDSDVKLELQEVFDAVYEAAGYADTLDYEHGTEPPLDAEDAAWAARLLQP